MFCIFCAQGRRDISGLPLPDGQDLIDGIISVAMDAFQAVSEIQDAVSGISGK